MDDPLIAGRGPKSASIDLESFLESYHDPQALLWERISGGNIQLGSKEAP